MAVRELTLLLKARDEASRALKDAGENAGKASVSFESVIKAAAMGGALSTMAGFMADISREAAADAAAMEAVRVATENAGGSWEDAEGEISAFIDAMRDSAAIADDDMKPALASLIAVTGDYGKSMELAALAADLARGKNMSLEAAAQLVGKVAMGNTSALTRYGIVLKDGATATEALGELQARFAGQAEAYGNTTKGQLEALSHRIGDFRENLGSALGAMQPVFAMLPGMSAAWTALGGVIGGSTPKLIAQTAATVAHGVASGVGTTVTAAMTVAQAALNAVMSANPIALVVIALAALAAGIIYAYNNSEEFRNAVDSLAKFLKDALAPAILIAQVALEGLRALWDWLSGNNTQTIDIETGATVDRSQNALDTFKQGWDYLEQEERRLMELAMDAGTDLSQRAVEGFKGIWEWFAGNATRTLEVAGDAGNSAVQAALDALKTTWDWLRTNTATTLTAATGFGTDAVQTLLEAIKTAWDWLDSAMSVSLSLSFPGSEQLKGVIQAIKDAWEWISKNASLYLSAVFSQSGNPPTGYNSVSSVGGRAVSGALGMVEASSAGRAVYLTVNVTGNTMIGSDRGVAIELARILKPEIDALANVSMSA